MYFLVPNPRDFRGRKRSLARGGLSGPGSSAEDWGLSAEAKYMYSLFVLDTWYMVYTVPAKQHHSAHA